MKTIQQMMNVDKARVIFDLFRDEIPEFLEYVITVADKIVSDKEEMIAQWNNPFISYQQWHDLSARVAVAIEKYGKKLPQSVNLFVDQLFDGYLAIFSNHCLEQYGVNYAKSPKFKQAVELFYLPVQAANDSKGSYIVVELHGGAECAAIVTDENGNNRVFEKREDAEAEAADCQDGLVINL